MYDTIIELYMVYWVSVVLFNVLGLLTKDLKLYKTN